MEGVRPLEDGWQDVIDAVLRRHRAPPTSNVVALAPKLVALSRAYNAGIPGGDVHVPVPLDARIAFSFARDVPKGAGAVRELVEAGLLAFSKDRDSLRIVDLGAGLGAMTWGILRGTPQIPPECEREQGRSVEALLVDEDADVLAAAEAIAREAASRLGPEKMPALTLRTRKERLALGMKLPEADVVVLGQVLSELDHGVEPADRAARHAALVQDLLERVVAPDGALVIVEPALRDRTRHLHAVRDLLVDRGNTVFAPCLHAQRCPALASENDWCHEDLAVDLPKWLEPLAQEAGLRWQGLSFSYLVLRRDARRLHDELEHGGTLAGTRVHLRVISERIVTKGKSEVFACTARGERLRLRRLDRDAVRGDGPGAAPTATWAKVVRGDVLTFLAGEEDETGEPPIDERGRISPKARIDVWPRRK
jgi:ribosomal protein RSM22 (predicted rRNA methylase)